MKDLRRYLDILKNDVKTRHHDTRYNSLYDDIDANILFECQEKFRNEYGHPRYKVYGNVFEEHGIFSKSREFASFISKFIENFIVDDKDHNIMFLCKEIPELRNDFFNILYVNFDDNFDPNTKGEYDYLCSDEKFIGNKFEYVTISINKNIDRKKIYQTIQHELNHFYKDLNKHKNKAGSLEDEIVKTNFGSLNGDENDSDFEKFVKDILYFLDKTEAQAYIAEFDGILGDEKFKNIQNGFNKIYESKLYKDIKNFAILMETNDDLLNKKLCDTYRNIYKANTTDEKILKMLRKKWNVFWKKFTNHIYQCVCDHVVKYQEKPNINIGSEDIELQHMKEYINKSIFVE